MKKYFTEKEGGEYHPEPNQITFGEFTKTWMKEVLPRYSKGKEDDYRKDINYWLLPYLRELPFSRITGKILREFVDDMKWKEGKNLGKPLSAHRKRNILIPLKAIWEDACDEFQWELRDPFKAAKKRIREDSDKEVKNEREIFLYAEWRRFLAKMNPYYHPVTEILVMTGMIASEIRGLRKSDVGPKTLNVRNSIVKGEEREKLKTQYRKREMPVTCAIRKRLMAAASASEGEYVFTMEDGRPFDFGSYRKTVWNPAMKAAGLTNKVPYSARHSLVQWALVVGVTPVRLVEIMGHRDKQMIFGVYGRYREGLVEERRAIIEYLGEDFLNPEKAAALVPHSDTSSETQGPETANCPEAVGF